MSLIKTEAPGNRHWLSKFFENDSFFKDDFFSNSSMPAVNVKDNDTSYEIEMAIPGFKKEEFKISMDNGILTLSGENKSNSENKDKNYTRQEFHYSSFSRSFSLPENADSDQIHAKYEDGLLKIEIMKKTSSTNQKKEIAIK